MTIEEFKKQEILRMIEDGLSMQRMANSLGITRQSVANWLWANNRKTLRASRNANRNINQQYNEN